jgi:DNA-binding NarL/FixJ family response regulator
MNDYRVITYRNYQVLQLLVEGKTAPQIGEELHMSERTVEAHRCRLKNVLGARTIADLVLKAVRNNLVESYPVEKPEEIIVVINKPKR